VKPSPTAPPQADAERREAAEKLKLELDEVFDADLAPMIAAAFLERERAAEIRALTKAMEICDDHSCDDACAPTPDEAYCAAAVGDKIEALIVEAIIAQRREG
jgi:hypothetical protein